MDSSSHDQAEVFWARRLKCPRELFSTAGLHFVDAPNPEAAFVLSVGPSTTVVAPPFLHASLAELAPVQLRDSAAVARVVPEGATVVGPAFVGYSLTFPEPESDLEALQSARSTAFDTLRAGLTPEAWRHANLEAASPPVYAVELAGSVVAASGANLLHDRVAHIGVATHPAHRGRGLARRVVSAVAFAASGAGLLPQYQTLHSNEPAMSVGRALGFERFATTISARWGSAAD